MDNLWNKVDLRTEFHCAYLLNMWNEPVLILRMCETNLYVLYTENAWKCWNALKIKYLGKLETKIQNILGCLSGDQKSSFGQTTLV
jgi:hypothetical protein